MEEFVETYFPYFENSILYLREPIIKALINFNKEPNEDSVCIGYLVFGMLVYFLYKFFSSPSQENFIYNSFQPPDTTEIISRKLEELKKEVRKQANVPKTKTAKEEISVTHMKINEIEENLKMLDENIQMSNIEQIDYLDTIVKSQAEIIKNLESKIYGSKSK